MIDCSGKVGSEEGRSGRETSFQLLSYGVAGCCETGMRGYGGWGGVRSSEIYKYGRAACLRADTGKREIA